MRTIAYAIRKLHFFLPTLEEDEGEVKEEEEKEKEEEDEEEEGRRRGKKKNQKKKKKTKINQETDGDFKVHRRFNIKPH